MKRTLAVILAGGEGERLSILSSHARQACRSVRRQVPHHRLLAVQLRELGHRQRRRPDPVQPALPERPHRHGPAVGPGPQQRRGADAAAVHRPRPSGGVVWRHGRCGSPEPQRNRAGSRRHGPGAGRRPHLQDGLPAVRGRASPPPGRRDDRGTPRPAGRRDAHGHPRPGRQRSHRRVAREAAPAQERPGEHGRLRLLQTGPPPVALRYAGRFRP